jgi:uncharacterized membrane protein YqjE
LDRPSSQEGGPGESARALGGSVLALAQARVELVAIELKEEADRHKRLLVLAGVAAVLLAMSLLLLTFLVIMLFWDSHRLTAMIVVTLAYAGAGGWAVLRFRQILNDSPPPFSATIAEFRKDLEMLRGSHD